VTGRIEDLSDCVVECGALVEIVRHHPAPMERGRVQGRPVEERIEAFASVQELTRRDLEQLPEGMRNSGTVKIFIDTEVVTVETSSCRVPDRIEFDGRAFQAQSVGDWAGAAGYYVVMATRVGR